MQHPRLRADYEPVVAAEGGQRRLFLLGESRRLVVDDPVAVDLVGLLDGTRTVGSLAVEMDGRHPLTSVLRALRRFEALDVLADGPAAVSPEQRAGWDALGVDPGPASAWPGSRPVVVVHTSPVVGISIDRVLAGLGLPVRTVNLAEPAAGAATYNAGAATYNVAAAAESVAAASTAAVETAADAAAAGGDAVVVVTDSALNPRLRAVNDAMLASGGQWVLVRPRGAVAMLGPHLVPGETGCWECLRSRWQENEQVENYLARICPDRPRPSAARGELPGTTVALAGLLLTELAVIAQSGGSPRLTGRMLALDTRDHAISYHTLVRQPQCPACGDPGLLRKADPKVTVTARPAGADSRAVAATDLVARLGHQVSPYLGVVTRLTPIDDRSDGVTFGYAAGHNFALGRDLDMLRRNLRGQSGGKGRTDVQARASALGEAIERYCGLWRDDRATHRASFAALGPERAVPLRDLLLFSDAQYADRDRRNAESGPFHWIPRRVADDVEMEWTPAWSLTAQRTRDLPAAYCWYGHPDRDVLAGAAADSNGCAAGSTLEEAIVQGFCEVVERDAVALWWYHRSRVPGVDLDSFDDPWVDDVRRFHADRLDRRLWVLDLTTDLGIPTYAGVSSRVGAATEDVVVGFGAALDPHVALVRALTEVSQFLPSVAHRNPDGTTRYGLNDPASLRWFTTVRTGDPEQAWLLPDPGRPPRPAAAHPRRAAAGDLAADVATCVDAAARAGLEVIVVDQSRPDIDLAVAKVVVPGARHFWRRLGPGRLWDVPARLGRHPVARDETDANPHSVFF
ncbi:TOMM precursor leader peptide-binding protein [Frankia sp. R43]|uniref:TOMM precursor leader peptide-binding protein n=1 Tax=Frankia sp. R43 TaxID=269536 RepID=UPI0006C9FDD8|nr:TOMM precursor leader peptide-binding protein [Frankia sp. R43]